MINFLPIPPLDGGQMVFLAAEKVRGRPLPESALVAGTYLGLFLVLGLMIFVTFQDIFRLFWIHSVGFPGGTIGRRRAGGPADLVEGMSTGACTMGVLKDRLIVDGDRYRLRSDGRTVSDLLDRLESGELPAAVIAP